MKKVILVLLDGGKMKKGYFFISDALIALFILVLGSIVAISFFAYQSEQDQVSFLSAGVLDYMYSNRIRDINSDLIGPNRELHRNENVTDLDNSFIIQLGEFYYRGEEKDCDFCKDLIRDSLKDVSGDFISEHYNFAFYIEGELMYNSTRIPYDESEVLIPAKTIIHGVYQDTEIWGPYTAEVWAWRG